MPLDEAQQAALVAMLAQRRERASAGRPGDAGGRSAMVFRALSRVKAGEKLTRSDASLLRLASGAVEAAFGGGPEPSGLPQRSKAEREAWDLMVEQNEVQRQAARMKRQRARLVADGRLPR